jgi:LCP family protein required for cell wall assembly
MPDAESDAPGPGPSRPRRSVGQTAAIVVASIVTFSCFATAGALGYGQHVIEQRPVVGLENSAEAAAETAATGVERESDGTAATGSVAGGTSRPPVEAGPTPTTFPPADPEAKNFLITGADNGSCIDPDSPFAPAFGDRSELGERSDTIMVWRVDPSSRRAAVLSLPRDLWVTIAGTGSQSRINSAYRRNDPQLLSDTIWENFGILIDHYIQVDFCAFKTLVDAVGGVAVPFDLPTRDTETGLNVPQAGCFTFTGDHALAYVRSRYYEVLPADAADPTSDSAWEMDQSFDLGRISRQQDFLRRLLARVLDEGMLNPSVVRGLYETMTDYVVTDDELSLRKMLEFAGVLRAIDPDVIPSYQVISTPETIAGNSVLVPTLEAPGMSEVIALFRGERSLSELPDRPSGQSGRRTGATTPSSGATPDTTTPATEVTVDDDPANIQYGVVPDHTIRC